MDASKLVFPDHSFDVACAAYVVSVVPDPVAVLKEMRRVSPIYASWNQLRGWLRAVEGLRLAARGRRAGEAQADRILE